MKYIYTFKVFVRLGSFPIDMLRYDRCTPATENDSGKIAGMCSRGYPREQEEATVTLTGYSQTRTPHITEARWKSFGCDVVRDSIEVRKMM